MQLNMRRSSLSLHLLIEFLHDHSVDVVLLQDICADLIVQSFRISGYSVFLPSRRGGGFHDSLPLVAVLVRDSLHARPIPFENQRMCGVYLSSSLGLLACVSAYIHYCHGRGLSSLSSMLTSIKAVTPLVFLGADSNGHSPWWGPPDQVPNETGQLFEDFVITQNMQIANTWPSPPTFVSDRGFEAWLDVSAVSCSLQPFLSLWTVLSDDDFASDHRAVLSVLTTTISACSSQPRLNWRSVEWDAFRTDLASRL